MNKLAFPILALAVLCASAVAAEQKIGYIDSDLLRDKMPEFKDMQRQLDRLKQQYEKEAMDRQSELRKLQEDFRKQELLMSDARKAEMQAQFDQSTMELQEFTQNKFGPEGELFRKNRELGEPIFIMINTAIEEIAREKGFDFIFDVAISGAIVYADPERFDLTDELLERLEEQREEKEKEKGRQ